MEADEIYRTRRIFRYSKILHAVNESNYDNFQQQQQQQQTQKIQIKDILQTNRRRKIEINKFVAAPILTSYNILNHKKMPLKLVLMRSNRKTLTTQMQKGVKM